MLSPNQKTDLNTPFTISEIAKAIDSLHNCKSLVPDGLLSEYYKLLKDTLCPHRCQMINDGASFSVFPAEMLKALVKTLPKPGKEPNVPQNVLKY